MSEELLRMCVDAKRAARRLAALPAETKQRALEAMAVALERREEELLAANARDQERAEPLVRGGEMSEALYKRLALGADKLRGLRDGVRAVRALPDPTGQTLLRMELDEGLILRRVSCPIGVLGVIFESRPDVNVQIAALAIKSGNAVILKGGAEAAESNAALLTVMSDALATVEGFPERALQQISSREAVQELLEMDGLVDLVIPRGSKGFIRHIMDHSRIPVMGHADGVCHVFVAEDAPLETAVKVVVDSKVDYPAACNAAETLLVERAGAARLLPPICAALEAAGVEVRGCPEARAVVAGLPPASAEDWDAEYLDLILSVRVVDDLEQAIDHIHRHGSAHTEAIVTSSAEKAEAFLQRVDAADVFHNASTRFADGFRFGFGAEVGISTSKLHARGPVGLEGLVTYKYELRGEGHCAADYGPGKRSFTHRRL